MENISFSHDCLSSLGQMIVPRGLGVQQTKIHALQEILKPHDVSDLCVLLGLANRYRHFVKNFSLIIKPLTMLTTNNQKWILGA